MKSLEFINFLTQSLGTYEAREVFEHIVQVDYKKALLNDAIVSQEAFLTGQQIIKQRNTGKPLAYILGYQYFFGYKFFVNESVLIPRFDSEIVVNTAINIAKNKNYSIIDLCCGSGCLGISIAKNANLSRLLMVDIEQNAISLSKKNAKNFGVKGEFVTGDILEKEFFLKTVNGFDIIICNPPYVNKTEYIELEKSVKDFEPKIALLAEENGLIFYKKILKYVELMINKPKYIVFEIGYQQANYVAQLIKYKNTAIKDLGGRDRCILIDLT